MVSVGIILLWACLVGKWLQVLLLNREQSSYSSHHTRAFFSCAQGMRSFCHPIRRHTATRSSSSC